MKESNRVRKLLIASAVVVLSIPAIAGAVPHNSSVEEATVRVSYSDLDLSANAGVVTLYKRLRRASSAFCGPQRSLAYAGSLQQLINNRHCYNDLLSQLVAKTDNAKLNEIHAG